ncbi:MAG: hypothetical protein AAF411_00745 [Myxococcota bacterium]
MRWTESLSNAGNDRSFNPAFAKAAAASSRRFFFEGVEGPVRAEVAHADASGVTLRQELPFLQLQGRLRDDQGREGRLENVSVAVRNGVPSLVLDVRYQGTRDATLPFLIESTRAMRATRALFDKTESAPNPAPKSKSTYATVDPLADTVEAAPKKPRRDATLPYGIRTAERDDETVPMPTVDELRPYTNAGLEIRPKPAGFWTRMWRRIIRAFAG